MEIQNQFDNLINNIFNIECPILNIKGRCGITGYIDFIKPDEFSESINKGKDDFDRKFITFRAIIEYENGESTETFTTLFQRYLKDNKLWMSAGNFSKLLFRSEGGTTIEQLEMLYELLKNGEIIINEKMIEKCRLIPFNYLMDDENDLIKPIKIRLFSKKDQINKVYEDVSHVMADLEKKINPKTITEGLSLLNQANLNNNDSPILNLMSNGANEFETRVGRKMTYSEMRAMWG